jgi:hypothetical protein
MFPGFSKGREDIFILTGILPSEWAGFLIAQAVEPDIKLGPIYLNDNVFAFLVDDASQLDSFLGITPHADGVPLLADAPDDSPVIQHLHAAFTKLIELAPRYRFSHGTALSGGSCADTCLLESSASEANGLTAKWLLWMTGGRPFLQLLQVNDGANLVASLVMGPTGMPSYAVKVEYERDEDDIVSNIQLLNTRWEILVEQKSVIADRAEIDAIVTQLPSDQEQTASVVLCEPPLAFDAIGPEFGLADELSRVLLGPHSLQEANGLPAQGSDLGWYENAHGNIGRAVMGLRHNWNDKGNGVFFYQNLFFAGHANRVALSAMSRVPELTVIPVGGASCLSRLDEWGPVVLNTGDPSGPFSKVVNITFQYFLDHESCNNTAGEVIRGELGRQFLWVMSAGNEGDRNPYGRCPQNVEADNKIVVTAVDRTQSRPLNTNDGRRYADLAALFYDPTGLETGTSFSAPRVSATVAVLAEQHPDFTLPMLKQLVLLSVDLAESEDDSGVSVSAFVEARTGGVLNHQRALDFGDCVAESEAREPAQLTPTLVAQCLTQTGDSPQLAEAKVGFFVTREVLPQLSN